MPTISRSNSPQVLGLVSMIAATSGASAARTASALDVSVRARRNGTHRIADQRRGRGVGAVGGIRNQHDAPGRSLAARLDRRLDRHHAAEFAMRAGLRRHRDGGHAGHRQQRIRPALRSASSAPCAVETGCSGCTSANPGSRAIFSLRRGLCFIVHEPSG